MQLLQMSRTWLHSAVIAGPKSSTDVSSLQIMHSALSACGCRLEKASVKHELSDESDIDSEGASGAESGHRSHLHSDQRCGSPKTSAALEEESSRKCIRDGDSDRADCGRVDSERGGGGAGSRHDVDSPSSACTQSNSALPSLVKNSALHRTGEAFPVRDVGKLALLIRSGGRGGASPCRRDTDVGCARACLIRRSCSSKKSICSAAS